MWKTWGASTLALFLCDDDVWNGLADMALRSRERPAGLSWTWGDCCSRFPGALRPMAADPGGFCLALPFCAWEIEPCGHRSLRHLPAEQMDQDTRKAASVGGSQGPWFSDGLPRGWLLSVDRLRVAAACRVATCRCSRRGSNKDLFTSISIIIPQQRWSSLLVRTVRRRRGPSEMPTKAPVAANGHIDFSSRMCCCLISDECRRVFEDVCKSTNI